MRTFLLMVAAAFTGVLLFVALAYAYFCCWQQPFGNAPASLPFPGKPETTLQAVPPIAERDRFYGTHGSTMGSFPDSARHTALAAGPGKITGRVTASGQPVQGLRLRLALNGAAMSQWAVTGADGRYEVALPYGRYRVDGYQIDSSIADSVLAGKTDAPQRVPFEREPIEVAEGRAGEGIDLDYVDPVRKLGPKGAVKAGEPIVVSWEPYPGAAAYRLQVVEARERNDFESQRRLFEWQARPLVNGTRADLAALKVELKKGYYYTVEIEALDQRNLPLSQSIHNFGRPDFRVE